MRERPYAITIMDKFGKVYFLTEELNASGWREDGERDKFNRSKKDKVYYKYFFRKRTEDICLKNILRFQTEELARDFWENHFEVDQKIIDNLYKYYNLDSLAICKVVIVKKDEVKL